MNTGLGPGERQRSTRLRPRAWTELLLVLGLFLAYKVGRLAVDGRVGAAYDDAHLVWHLERALRLPDEVDLQHMLLQAEALVRTANIYYAVVHFPATIAFLVFMYCFRPEHYIRFRRILAWLTAVGLGIHFVFPLAPPRMLGGLGLIDTAAVYGPSVYGPPQTDTLSNQYAAMPSLHVGWALVIAAGLIHATRTPWRWLWLAHPVLTMLVVAGTANHYWLDGIVAAVLVGVLLVATSRHEHPSPAVPVQVRRTARRDAIAGTLAAVGTALGAAGVPMAPPGAPPQS
ncbi:phosphatase PAP2 family protein [Dactylosporangium salmoneum]|uniref:phosphatase PAP2 family protein n=1 Tax=Dactylosporangium salmoneum TaxID=53361 RepID=UPI0031E40F66